MPPTVPKMLLRRYSRLLRPQTLARFKHTGVSHFKNSDYDVFSSLPSQDELLLPFNQKRHSELFGQVVRSEPRRKSGEVVDLHEDYVRRPEDPITSDYRNPDGSLVRGSNAEEARLDPLTLEGRSDHSVVKLPRVIAKTIQNNILSQTMPSLLRERAAEIYRSLEKDLIQKAPAGGIDSDAYIAALFLQDYANVRKVLVELKKRVGASFKPDSVLDIGYGPATGMVALNELMGADFRPKDKDAYIVGRRNDEMKKRAKIILSRQLSEVPDELLVEVDEAEEPPKELKDDNYVGPVDARRIKVKTKLRDSLASTKKYDLIIVNQALLTREHSFPRDVDLNLEMVLNLLSPNGHLVLVERGNPLGFEIIARARQVMLRPENFESERGKIPRPYIRGSKPKPQKLRDDDKMVTEEHIEHEAKLMKQLQEEIGDVDDAELEKQLNERFGALSEKDLKFEDEDDVDIIDPLASSAPEQDYAGVDFHLSIVAPCPHHGKCPLQLGDPNLYKVRNHKHRFSFCSFNNIMERPRYTMELKKGKALATLWEKEELLKSERKAMEGGGRPGGHNSELGDYSYLIVHRSPNDKKSIEKIESDREHSSSVEDNSSVWPRLVTFPSKVKKNVKFDVCAPSGSIETWQVPRSVGKQAYHDARKARQGDLWPLGKKTVTVKSRFSEEGMARLKLMAKSQRNIVIKEKRKKEWKKMIVRDAQLLEEGDEMDPDTLHEIYASKLTSTKKYRQQSKRHGFE